MISLNNFRLQLINHQPLNPYQIINQIIHCQLLNLPLLFYLSLIKKNNNQAKRIKLLENRNNKANKLLKNLESKEQRK